MGTLSTDNLKFLICCSLNELFIPSSNCVLSQHIKNHFFSVYNIHPSPAQAPPGIKKNLLRSYESWSPEFVSRDNNTVRSQALFALAWFHAVCQERRNFIPQGWTKFYEFSLSDLRAGADIINRLSVGRSKWFFFRFFFLITNSGGL